MTIYKARLNESPSMIARRFRVPLSSLIAANPHKPTTRVGNVTTWRGLQHRESIRLPAGAVGTLGDFLGDSVSDAINALVAAGGPCLQANVGLVCNVQRALGVGVDGKYGSGTATAAKAHVSSAPAGCSPRPAWWAPPGASNCPSGAAPTASATPTAPPSGLTAAARAAASALAADANYCASVARPGTAVNTAVHNFKAAWNSANPTRPVPIGTGKYEPVVAQALSESLGGATVPPGCGAAATPTASTACPPGQYRNSAGLCVYPDVAPGPAPTSAPSGSTATAVPIAAVKSGAPAAVMALLAIDPCLQANASIVTAAQKALGVGADGKYGNDTATAARRVLPNAPAGCSPRPAWWTAPGQTNASSGASQAATAAQSAANTAQAAATAAQNAQTAGQATAAATQAAAAATAATTAAAAAAPDQKPAAEAAAATAVAAAQKADTAAQAAGGGSAITPPEAPKKLSTGAIVVGAVGAAALVGIAAMALGGKKGGGRRSSGGGRRKPSKKRKASHGKRKTKSKKRK